jgi:uncharacterized protein YjbI with pentapeptide repeats
MRKLKIKNLRNYPFLLAAFLLIIVGTNIVTYVYAHGGDANLIHACVRNNLPNLPNIRIVGANQNCGSNETPLDWNALGLPGTGAFVSNLQDADLSSSDLKYRDFKGANLSNGVFNSTNFLHANLTNANLTNANFDSAYLNSANLTGVNLSGAIFTRTNLEGAIISGNLTQTDFTNADLHTTSFGDISGSQTNFTNTDLSQAHFNGAVNLTDTIWSNTTCPDGTNSNNNGNTCVGHLTL